MSVNNLEQQIHELEDFYNNTISLKDRKSLEKMINQLYEEYYDFLHELDEEYSKESEIMFQEDLEQYEK